MIAFLIRFLRELLGRYPLWPRSSQSSFLGVRARLGGPLSTMSLGSHLSNLSFIALRHLFRTSVFDSGWFPSWMTLGQSSFHIRYAASAIRILQNPMSPCCVPLFPSLMTLVRLPPFIAFLFRHSPWNVGHVFYRFVTVRVFTPDRLCPVFTDVVCVVNGHPEEIPHRSLCS